MHVNTRFLVSARSKLRPGHHLQALKLQEGDSMLCGAAKHRRPLGRRDARTKHRCFNARAVQHRHLWVLLCGHAPVHTGTSRFALGLAVGLLVCSRLRVHLRADGTVKQALQGGAVGPRAAFPDPLLSLL